MLNIYKLFVRFRYKVAVLTNKNMYFLMGYDRLHSVPLPFKEAPKCEVNPERWVKVDKL